MTRRKHIKNTISDLVAKLLYYDRKEDEDLPLGEIEKAVEGCEISVDEMVQQFKTELRNGLGDCAPDGPRLIADAETNVYRKSMSKIATTKIVEASKVNSIDNAAFVRKILVTRPEPKTAPPRSRPRIKE